MFQILRIRKTLLGDTEANKQNFSDGEISSGWNITDYKYTG